VSAFAVFGGVPLSLLYDNLKIAVAKICGDGKRERTRAFAELVSHYLFADRFGRPGKGNDKGNVEGLVKYSRLNFMVPIPEAASFDELNARLEAQCRQRQAERAGRHAETIGERLVADTAALRALPAVPLEPCETRSGRCGSTWRPIRICQGWRCRRRAPRIMRHWCRRWWHDRQDDIRYAACVHDKRHPAGAADPSSQATEAADGIARI
jgi:hypothetical protein